MTAMLEQGRTNSLSEVRQLALRCMAKKRPFFIWGPPGIGKSDLMQQITDSYENAHLIDVRLPLWDPTDIKGMPYYAANDNTMKWAPPAELPSAEMAKQYDTIVLFLDELNAAPQAVQAAAYQLILNRRVGTYVLPDNVVIAAAGNRESDKGVTYRMPKPLANRFVHFEVRVDFNDWFDWAVANDIHADVVGYLTANKQDLYDFDPSADSRSFATPRSWAFVSELLDDEDDGISPELVTDLVAGAVGEGLAIKFMAHRKVAGQMPNPTDILDGKVKELKTKEISAMYSLTTSLCYELKESFEQASKDGAMPDWHKRADRFFKFIMDNFETEMVVLGSRTAIKNYSLPFNHKKMESFKVFYEKFGKLISKA